MAIVGTVAFLIAAFALVGRLSESVRHFLISGPGIVWLVATGLGTTVQLAGWTQRFRSRCDTRASRIVITTDITVQLAGMMMCRELVRATKLGERLDFDAHLQATTSGEFALFLLFCAINGAVSAWCIRLGTPPEGIMLEFSQ